MAGAEHQCCGATFWIYILIILGLVLFAGLMSGLTLGLMSLGLVDLEVLIKSGTEKDRRHAAKILPVVKNQHLLLCTLLIGNSIAMEALPIFLDSLVPAWGAILMSVTLILMFGEIIPQAVCTRYGLAVGAAMAPIVRVLLLAFFPVAYPISKVKNLLTIRPEDNTSVKDVTIRKIPRIKVNMLASGSSSVSSSLQPTHILNSPISPHPQEPGSTSTLSVSPHPSLQG